jgi:hypothetical protein
MMIGCTWPLYSYFESECKRDGLKSQENGGVKQIIKEKWSRSKRRKDEWEESTQKINKMVNQ